MCGICGEVRFDGRDVDIGAVTRMTAAMQPRGPDGSGEVDGDAVERGRCR